MKERNYEALVAGMHRKQTFEGAEEVIRKDFKLKLPDRRYIHIWNSAEISQFRGVQELHDKQEAARGVVEQEKMDIRREAQAQDVPMPDMSYVHEAMQAQRQQASAFTAHTEDLNRAHAAQMAGMQRETISEMERLANAQAEAAKRARIAEQALSGLRDVQMEDRDRLSKLAESQGVTHNHIDQSVVNNNTQNVTQDTNVHNQVMHLVNTHGAQFGSFMEQQRMSQEAMMRLLHEHVRQTQPASVIYMMPPADSPMEVVQYTGSGPPPPPPAGVAL